MSVTPSVQLLLLLLSLAWPAAMLLACLARGVRERMPGWLALAPAPALGAAVLAAGGPALVFDWAPCRIILTLDKPGALLLGAAALLWIAAGVYAGGFFRARPMGGRFTACWLMVLIGSMGIFMAADLASFLVCYALVSLPAYGLITHDPEAGPRRAGAIYLGFALFGESLLLMAFVLLAAGVPGDELRISDLVARLPASPTRDVTLALLLAGFGMKIALVPLHFWMPLTYQAAPVPAAAVLSGAAVKAGVVGLIRFLPNSEALPDWGGPLAAVGLFGAFYGVAVGLTQSHLKSVLAYSSVSQMGFLAAVLGMGLADGEAAAGLMAAFYAANHVLVKGALFLAVGLAGGNRSCRMMMALIVVPAGVIGLGLAGLPFMGGALAKLAVKVSLGNGWVAFLATWSAAGTTLLMLHFLRCLAGVPGSEGGIRQPSRLLGSWLTLVVLCIALPWVLFPLCGMGPRAAALAPDALAKTLWPVLVGGGLFLLLRFWEHRLPRIPNGDVVELAAKISKPAATWSAACQILDRCLRQWSAACFSVLIVAVVLTLMLLFAR